MANKMRKPNILAIIPARGGSKGIPRKNIKKLKGKPLLYYTIKEAKKSKFLSKIVVSTDDEEIARISRKYRVTVIRRPQKLAQDTTPGEQVFKHAITYLEKNKGFHTDIVVILQPTSPFRKVDDIENSIKKFLKINCNTVVTVCEVSHPPYWMYRIKGNDKLVKLMKTKKAIKRRQESPTFYQLNGAVYVTGAKTIMKNQNILKGDVRAYIMPYERSLELDNMFDFKLAKLLIENQ